MFKNSIKYLLSYLPLVLVFLGLLSLNLHKAIHTVTVFPEKVADTLYFPGVVRPYTLFPVVTKFPGNIEKMPVNYGQEVKTGDLLFVIQSQGIIKDFRSNLQNYIKAKASLQNAQYQFNGNEELYKLGLISKIAFTDNA